MRLNRLGLCLVLLAPLMAFPARAAEVPDVRFEIVGPSTIGFGVQVKYRLTVENTTPETITVRNELMIESVATGIAREFKRIVWTIPPGGTEVRESELPVGHWYSEPGRYRIAAEDNFGNRETAGFRMTESRLQPALFRDVTEELGLHTELTGSGCGDWTAGAAWADIDGDEDLDLFVPRDLGSSNMFVNEGASFVDEAAARGVANDGMRGLGAVFVDYDNDGDQDLYVTNYGFNRLYQNDGTGMFTDQTDAAGVAGLRGPNESASWGDYDDDGFVDLYVSRHVSCTEESSASIPHPDFLFHSNGDGTFTEVTDLLHREGSTLGAGFQALWFDYDNDGDLDIYLGNDYYGAQPQPNVLWRNDGPADDGTWIFSNVSSTSGAGLIVNSMGLAPLDYDRDGDIDVAISNIYDPIFLSNRGDGTFAERGDEVGLDTPSPQFQDRPVTWGVVPGDLNLDGFEDLYFPAGSLVDTPLDSYVFLNNKRNGFFDMTAGSGAGELDSASRGVAQADYDRDGRLDLFVVNQAGVPHLLRNVTPRNGAHRLQVELTGSRSNRDACGARLVLVTEKARLLRTRYCGGVGLGSGHDPLVHFGLGKNNPIRKLIVTWPSGTRQVERNVQPDSILSLQEPV